MNTLASYPTPAGAAHEERMNDGFIKLHPGPPVHVFTKPDLGHFHDHPFDFTTHIIEGGYDEEVLVPEDGGRYHIETFRRQAGTSHTVKAGTAHRIAGLPAGFCVTRADYGPKVQEPGFYDLRPDGIYRRDWNGDWQPWPRP